MSHTERSASCRDGIERARDETLARRPLQLPLPLQELLEGHMRARGGAGFGIVGALALAASPSRLSMLARTSSAGFMDKQNWVVIGDVLNEAKPAARVVSTLREAGKTVHLVNPRDKTGTCKPTLSAVEDPVEVVDLIINSRDGIKQVEQMVSLGIKQIWIQPGAGSEEILALCRANGIEIFQGCVMVEFGSR